MRYIKVALLTIVFCLGSIVLALIGVFIWAEVTKEKPQPSDLYSETTYGRKRQQADQTSFS